MGRVRCLNCGRRFDGHEDYQRHMWADHGGELDKGAAWT